MVFNCCHFKNYQTRYTKWWRNVGEHYVFNLSTFRLLNLKNKHLKSNHLQSSTLSGCCENIPNVYKMILWEFFRRMILTNYICMGKNFHKYITYIHFSFGVVVVPLWLSHYLLYIYISYTLMILQFDSVVLSEPLNFIVPHFAFTMSQFYTCAFCSSEVLHFAVLQPCDLIVR